MIWKVVRVAEPEHQWINEEVERRAKTARSQPNAAEVVADAIEALKEKVAEETA